MGDAASKLVDRKQETIFIFNQLDGNAEYFLERL